MITEELYSNSSLDLISQPSSKRILKPKNTRHSSNHMVINEDLAPVKSPELLIMSELQVRDEEKKDPAETEQRTLELENPTGTRTKVISRGAITGIVSGTGTKDDHSFQVGDSIDGNQGPRKSVMERNASIELTAIADSTQSARENRSVDDR